MLRELRRRLDKLWKPYQYRVKARETQDIKRIARETFVRTLRYGLRRAGIDPATVPAMRDYDEPAPPPAPPARPRTGLERYYDTLAKIARRYRDCPLDIETATPRELFAVYCFDEAAGPEGIVLLASDPDPA
jgi:hypothetical protein